MARKRLFLDLRGGENDNFVAVVVALVRSDLSILVVQCSS